MSNALFHHTVTLYLADKDNSTYERRTVETVRVRSRRGRSPKDTEMTVYLPLYGRRQLRYVTPEAYERNPAVYRFTVRPGDSVALGHRTDTLPPADALTVDTVTVYTDGTRRLWHIRLTAVPPSQESEVTV